MTINVNHYFHLPDGILNIDKNFSLIFQKLNLIMTKQEQLDAALSKIDAATNDIAADLKLLKGEILAGAVTDESLAKLDLNAAALEALGNETPGPVLQG